ncbi:hypothetical protein FB565_001532 [Actinoplanes lutulentus]|uniref:Uncharacterized protein n=1 Tax=Actinoplanes lutulentus TaxID=1287878 RepID=A0A327ZKR5_9ACTN|nr:hypothetical protein [Actinoplanes lutulentus]MBB2941828.1 hypothetical protein [Actinoplanes lutulentus]RAK39747.1 hypothetical protein B0I29_104285 [Actinoplanes lutulentus]
MTTTRLRPLLAIRLIGPAETVTAQKAHLIGHLAAITGDRATCRVSTHPARHTGEIRVYLTVTPKGDG